MRSSPRPRRAFGLALSSLLLLLALFGCLCTPDTGRRGSAQRCTPPAFEPPDAVRDLEIGEAPDNNEQFLLLSDGSEVTLIRGFQGDSMLLPRLRIAREADDPGTVCATIELRHGGAEGDAGGSLVRAYELRRDGDHYLSGAIELPGVVEGAVTLEATVTTEHFTASRTLTLNAMF